MNHDVDHDKPMSPSFIRRESNYTQMMMTNIFISTASKFGLTITRKSFELALISYYSKQ